METFGQRLRAARIKAGLNQAGLAGEGISASYVSLLESERRPAPRREVVAQLATKLGCSARWLLNGQASEGERQAELDMSFARLALEHGEPAAAAERLEALHAREDLDSDVVRDDVAFLLGRCYELSGRRGEALRALLPVYERARSGHTHVPLCDIGVTLVGCYLDGGDLARAIEVAEEALAAARNEGLAGTAPFYRLCATLLEGYFERGDYAHVALQADLMIAEAEAGNERGGAAVMYWNAALAAEASGEVDRALYLCSKAMAHLSELGGHRDLARLRLQIAEVLLACDPPRADAAAAELDKAADLLADLGSQVERAIWGHLRSTAALLLDDPVAALEHARAGVQRLTVQDSPLIRGRAQLALADALAALAQRDDARLHTLEAAATLRSAGSARAAGSCWRQLAERLVGFGELEAAVEALSCALDCAGLPSRSAGVMAAIDRAAPSRVAAYRVATRSPAVR